MFDPRLLTCLEGKKARLDSLCPLHDAMVAQLREQITLVCIYNSNTTEASTLALVKHNFSWKTDLTIVSKSLRERFEVLNHKAPIEYVEHLVGQVAPLTAYDVSQIQ